MCNAQIQSIVARCLTEPDFLDRASADPASALGGYALEESARSAFIEFDFARLRSFAGFIAKVQHNYLWEAFPGTLNLLKLTGLQIPVFSSYNRIHQRLRAEGSTGRDEKIRCFLDYLGADLAHRREAGVPLLRDVLAHEEAIWRVAGELQGMVDSTGEAAGLGGETLATLGGDRWDSRVPSIRGMLAFRSHEFDPVTALSELERGVLDVTSFAPDPGHIGYWGDPVTRKVRVLVLDRETAILLAAVDGRRTVGAIIERTASTLGDGIGGEAFRSFFEEAYRSGLLVEVPGHDPNEGG